MNPEIFTRLMKLMPALSSLTDKHRLKTLANIDRVMISGGITWHDVAAALRPPSEWTDVKAAVALEMVDAIEQWPELACHNAGRFIEQIRDEANEQDTVYLSPRQSAWLHMLHEKAKAKAAKAEQQAVPERKLHLVS
jgi:hypothetical protein